MLKLFVNKIDNLVHNMLAYSMRYTYEKISLDILLNIIQVTYKFRLNEETVDQHNCTCNNVCLTIDFERIDTKFHNIHKYWLTYIVLDTFEDNEQHTFEHWYKLSVVHRKYHHTYKNKHPVDWDHFDWIEYSVDFHSSN